MRAEDDLSHSSKRQQQQQTYESFELYTIPEQSNVVYAFSLLHLLYLMIRGFISVFVSLFLRKRAARSLARRRSLLSLI